MISNWPDELRLLLLLAINAIVIVAAWRFARRRGERDSIQLALDTMLLWYLVQYFSVAIPGMIGVLNTGTMIGGAIVCSAGLWTWPGKDAPIVALPVFDRRVVSICIATLLAFIGAVIWIYRAAPPVANDALTYHLPAAAQWLRTGRIGLFETWFFNPANTYSPLAGSVFLAWLFAPIGNDCVAQFVQAPALLMIFLATMQLSRAIGVKTTTAAIVALALCCSRPMISQSVLTKDDLLVVAFFGTALAGLQEQRAWSAGVALGLMLATKYTALFAVPIFFLMRWNRREVMIVSACVLALAGPWLLRNLLLTGDPIFPMFSMFTTARSRELSSVRGIWKSLLENYSAMPIAPTIALVIAWVVALTRNRKRLPAVVVFGPVVGLAIFLLVAPFPEARFIYPCYLLLLVASAWAGAWAAPALLVIAIATSFVPHVLLSVCIPFLVIWIVLVVAARYRIIALIVALLLLPWIYVDWQAFISRRQAGAVGYWKLTYGPLADAWGFVRETVPRDATIAYANTSFAYPLMNNSREVVYIPVRVDVRTIADLGHFDGRIAGEDLVDRIVARMNENANEDAWLARMQSSGVRFLLVAKSDRASPEMRFASANPHFVRIFDNSAASVYKIDW